MGSLLPFITAFIWLYAAWRVVWLLPLALPGRLLLGLLLFLAAEYHWVTSRYFGSLASPELPQGVLIFLSWAFGTVLLLALLALVCDVAGTLVLLVSRGAGKLLLGNATLRAGLGVAAVLLSAYGVWQAVRVPSVKSLDITVPGLPSAFDGYRVVQLTDLHASRLLPAKWMAAVVARTLALDADLIVITGDLVDGSPTLRAPDVAPLKQLRARDGVLAIPGNHEYYSDYARWMQAFSALGLTMLENAHVVIRRDEAALAVVGLTDRQSTAFGLPGPDLSAALKGLAPDIPALLLAHRPAGAVQHAQAGIALQLSGHTHGGQILGPHLLTQWANEGYVSGLYQVDGMPLYVSNGTGLWNGLALRLGRPSEITAITLRAGPARHARAGTTSSRDAADDTR